MSWRPEAKMLAAMVNVNAEAEVGSALVIGFEIREALFAAKCPIVR